MKKLLFFFIILSLISITVFAQQDYLMPTSGSASYTTCSGNFYDAGGPSGNYSSGQDATVTFYPTDTINQKLSINFSSFATYSSQDYLDVFNGSSTAAAKIAHLFGTVGVGSIISTATNGSLTLHFYSYYATPGVAAGWAATISCVAPLSIPASGDIAMLSSGIYKTCSANFYDVGGASGNYIHNQDVTVTFYPTDTINQKLSINFSSFATYSSQDYLDVFNGSSTAAAKIAHLFGTVGAGSIISTATNGSLTLHFYSYYATPGVAAGWAATISCVAPLSIPASGDIAMLSSGIYKTCSANFYDVGGASGNYIHNQDVTVTFYPTDTINQKLSINFSSFATYSSQDYLDVFNGSSTAAAKIAHLFGTVGVGSIISTATNGSLTLHFYSYYATPGVAAGWAATISCVAPLSIPASGDIAMLSSGIYKTCSANFYDVGGASGNYIHNQDVTVTFYPTDTINQKLSINFSSFATYSSQDYLDVFNGSSTAAAKIAHLFGTVGVGSIISTATNGSLTLHFYSYYATPGVAAGWAATISCTGGVTNFSLNSDLSQVPPWQREKLMILVVILM